MLEGGGTARERVREKETRTTWISSKRRAYHVYAGLYELDASATERLAEMELGLEYAGTGRPYGPEQLLVYLFEWGCVDRGMDQGTVVDTTHRDTTTTLFFLMRPPPATTCSLQKAATSCPLYTLKQGID
jgi:hypothetical protein